MVFLFWSVMYKRDRLFLWHSYFKLSAPLLDWNQVLFQNKMVFLSSVSINFVSNRRITTKLHILQAKRRGHFILNFGSIWAVLFSSCSSPSIIKSLKVLRVFKEAVHYEKRPIPSFAINCIKRVRRRSRSEHLHCSCGFKISVICMQVRRAFVCGRVWSQAFQSRVSLLT
jgi:hypothetical protein